MRSTQARRLLTVGATVASGVLLLAACGGSSGDQDDEAATEATETTDPADTDADDADTTDEAGDEQAFPDVIDVEVERSGDSYDFAVTISSPYDTPQRYADGWRVVGPDGTVYGEHQLLHDHANEQPFTRRQTGVAVPDDVDEVTIEGRDLDNGYGGGTLIVKLPE